jgi:hypothetical protein
VISARGRQWWHVDGVSDSAGDFIAGAEILRRRFSGEPLAGYIIRGPYADGTFKTFGREDGDSERYVGTADSYDGAQDLAAADRRES